MKFDFLFATFNDLNQSLIDFIFEVSVHFLYLKC